MRFCKISNFLVSAHSPSPAGNLARITARRFVERGVETSGGVFQVREDEPAPQVGAGLHRTP